MRSPVGSSMNFGFATTDLCQHFLANLAGGIWPAKSSSRARHSAEFARAQQLLDAERQILDTIDLRRGAAFQQKIAISGFLAWNWIYNDERFAHGQHLRTGQAAWFGNNEVGGRHQ